MIYTSFVSIDVSLLLATPLDIIRKELTPFDDEDDDDVGVFFSISSFLFNYYYIVYYKFDAVFPIAFHNFFFFNTNNVNVLIN